jgi:hypothetical protein
MQGIDFIVHLENIIQIKLDLSSDIYISVTFFICNLSYPNVTFTHFE